MPRFVYGSSGCETARTQGSLRGKWFRMRHMPLLLQATVMHLR